MNAANSPPQQLKTKPEFDIRASVHEVIYHLQSLLTDEVKPAGLTTGFSELDALTNELQLLRSDSPLAIESRERELLEITSALKNLARELCLPIMVLACLNRGPERRRKPRPGFPRSRDLMESPALLHAADLICLLYRPEFYAEDFEKQEAEAGKAELLLVKNGSGQTGEVHLSFCAERMRFKSRSTQVE